MRSRWNEEEALAFTGDLAQRVYTSRLLGRDPSLVLHGGGNTSVKSRVRSLFGEEEEILYVKGSGWDLETIEPAGFTPCRMSHLLRLAQRETLSDTQMALELKKSQIDPNAPAASVEAILHAILPAKFVDHTHADWLLAITNTEDGESRVRDIYGATVVVIPYVMPGFKLARLCAEVFPRNAGPHTIGMLLMNHGLFSFADTAKGSYERMIELVTRAEEYLERQEAASFTTPKQQDSTGSSPKQVSRTEIAALRQDVSKAAGAPMILAVHDDAESLSFARRGDLGSISQQGPATPDHVIRTKRVPLLGRDVAAYAAAYRQYFEAHAKPTLKMLDPAPRVILDRELGLCAIGRTARDARIVEDIYRHTMEIVSRATGLGGWKALPEQDIFDVEYWDLEQAKLKKGGTPPVFTGEVALVTGAASGIGKACVGSLLKRGAAVVGLDVDPGIVTLHSRPDCRGLVCDLTDEKAVGTALDEAIRTFGGLDLLVLNAGVFPRSARVADLSDAFWRRVFDLNLDANVRLLREAHPLLKLSYRGGRVVVIGSKNVAAPGPGAAAYSASKAALNQLARVTALEWGADRIRVNMLHPNAVFDTGIWTEDVLASRARSYGLSVDEYKKNNVLGVEITSYDVAELAAEACGPLFAKTTGAQIPVDGGNERVI